ncbi:MAG: NUDIX domain-containing protein [Candidatus Competibacteraceae bacterium]|nr:NUDIX domain-containing protein [Candidatus Competibacteraceae bacterium]
METYRLTHELFRGGWTDPVYRECLERGHAVALLPYDPVRDEVVLAEQFRVGALGAETGPWLLEIVAGIIDKDETPEEVARREAVEEAGCPVEEVEFISHYYVSPGGTSETVTLYCSRVSSQGVGGIHGLADEHEDIRVQAVPRSEAWRMVGDGRINSAAPIIALQWLELNHGELQRRWR